MQTKRGGAPTMERRQDAERFYWSTIDPQLRSGRSRRKGSGGPGLPRSTNELDRQLFRARSRGHRAMHLCSATPATSAESADDFGRFRGYDAVVVTGTGGSPRPRRTSPAGLPALALVRVPAHRLWTTTFAGVTGFRAPFNDRVPIWRAVSQPGSLLRHGRHRPCSLG